ncbi:nodulation protein NfeD [Roseiconus nitratireducens]|uniref:Nodulation protein NfeD n=1 Tax=Roseiconus nitratireducens TaxID=2605748 RepID=A0A5M6D0T4_9BACT|nr:NfeD family protein [Roseiconus nitratireducens]KAA5540656.1 nodulation protein NfeD [Roseiconus nitratireducens]
MPLTYSFGLLAVFFLLLVAEFLVPSGGLLGLAAAIAAFSSIAIAFTHSVPAGLAFGGTIALCTPAVLYAMVLFWPHTAIGRRILNRRPGQLDEPTESLLRSGGKRKDLIGRIGVAKTHLLPGGLVIIDDQRLDAVTDGSPIDAGTQVIVVNTSAGKIRVRAASEADLNPQQAAARESTEAIESSLESLDLGPLDD